MKKLALLVTMILLTTGTVGATGFTEDTEIALPGETTTLGNLTVANSSGISTVTNTSDFPLNWEYTDNGTHRTGPVNITVPHDASPRPNADFTVTTKWNNNTETTSTITYEIPAVSNVTINKENLSQDVSVGSDGLFGNLTLEQQGNSAEEVRINTTGNLSTFLGMPGSVTMYRGRTYDLRVTFQVPQSTPFGHYTGSLLFVNSSDDVTHTVNVSSQFSDDIQPSIETVEIPGGVMATTPLDIEATVTDNLNISTVTAHVVREVSVTNGNTTNAENQTLGTFQLGQKPQTDDWNTTITDTDEIGTYYATITATDTSGNNDTVVERFSINGLNATNTVSDEIVFDTIRHDSDTREPFITNKFDSPFNTTLNQFNYVGNATLQIGIVPPGADTPRYFDGVNDTMHFDTGGTYSVVVNSLGTESVNGSFEYNGEIAVFTPSQDPENPEVVFTGIVSAEERPDPQSLQIGEFKGFIGYGNAVARFEEKYGSLSEYTDAVVYVGVMNSTRCLGVNSWSGCSTLSFGELERAELEREQALEQASEMTFQRNVAAAGATGIVLWVVITYYAAGSLVIFSKPKKKNIDMQPVENTGTEEGDN